MQPPVAAAAWPAHCVCRLYKPHRLELTAQMLSSSLVEAVAPGEGGVRELQVHQRDRRVGAPSASAAGSGGGGASTAPVLIAVPDELNMPPSPTPIRRTSPSPSTPPVI